MKSLTKREEEIMEHYWDKGEMHIRELQALYDDPKPHVNTLSTLVHILEDKGFLSHKALTPKKTSFSASHTSELSRHLSRTRKYRSTTCAS